MRRRAEVRAVWAGCINARPCRTCRKLRTEQQRPDWGIPPGRCCCIAAQPRHAMTLEGRRTWRDQHVGPVAQGVFRVLIQPLLSTRERPAYRPGDSLRSYYGESASSVLARMRLISTAWSNAQGVQRCGSERSLDDRRPGTSRHRSYGVEVSQRCINRTPRRQFVNSGRVQN
jgi:hypothetical protein